MHNAETFHIYTTQAQPLYRLPVVQVSELPPKFRTWTSDTPNCLAIVCQITQMLFNKNVRLLNNYYEAKIQITVFYNI